MRMPLTIWGIFTATVLAMFAFPALLVGCLMMTLDSLLGTSFFMPAMVSLGETLTHEGGSPILFQHLFWFFGHLKCILLHYLLLELFQIYFQFIQEKQFLVTE